MIKTGEFHIHTLASDGQLEVEEILREVNGQRDYIAITDHDILDNSIKAYAITNNPNSNYSVKSIIGVEISTYNLGESVHVLAYFNKVTNLSPIIYELDNIRKKRIERLHKIADLLKSEFNIELDLTEILNRKTITRGTIGREIIRQGYPYTREYIFENILGNDCPCYVPVDKISTSYAVNLIHRCHGLAVLAHPGLLKKQKASDLMQYGFDGIEVYYPLNKENETNELIELANSNNLLILGGSDFHQFDDGKHGNLLEWGIEGKDLDKFIDKINNL